MNILIQSYATCCQNESGGVQIRIKSLVDALRKKGVTVDYFDTFNTKIDNYDILHIFMLNIESVALARVAKSKGKKIVLSSVINCINGKKIDFYRMLSILPLATTYKFLFELIKLADLIIVESVEESNFLTKHYKADQNKITLILNGAKDFSNGNDEIFNVIGLKKKYVLQVGRFDQNKNQLNVIKALKYTDINVVFIGGPSNSDNKYYYTCLEEANGSDNFFFLGWVDNESDLMCSAYSNASVLIVPSYSETFGLTIIEGAIAGANIVLSNKLSILKDHHFTSCLKFDPDDLIDLRNKVQIGLNKKRDLEFQKKIKSDFTWDSIANEHIQRYKELTNEYFKKN